MTQNTISDRVASFLDNDFIVRKCLFKNIISLRALSRHIIKRIRLKDKNLNAVMSAIRRYKKTEREADSDSLKNIFLKVAVKTRSDVVDIRVQKNKKSIECIGKLNSAVDIEKGEILRTIQAEQSITIMIDDKNIEKFYSIFQKSDILSINKKLVEINLQFTKEAQEIKGIIAIVTSSLNAEGINIVEIMSSAPELLVIVKKENLLRALNVVDNLQNLL